MKVSARDLLTIFKKAAIDWMNDKAPQLGASVAFYTIFSLAPLITIVISIAALWFSENASQEIFSQLGNIVGANTAKSLESILVQDSSNKSSGIFTSVVAFIMLIAGATGIFVQLQDALNEIWEVKPKPGQGIMGFVRHRLLSFAMVLVIGFLLLVSLLLTAVLGAIGKYLSGVVGNMETFWQIVNMVVSFGVTTLLFAFIYKYMPDAEIRWKDVWVGAIFTSVLFTIGKFALGLYLARSSLASTYGAAGSLIVVLLWVYYSAQILFYGAEVTQVWANEYGHKVEPSPHAERDIGKKLEREHTEKDRERKKAAKEAGHAVPVPARASLNPKLGSATATAMSREQRPSKLLGGLVLLLLMFLPLERRSADRSHA